MYRLLIPQDSATLSVALVSCSGDLGDSGQ